MLLEMCICAASPSLLTLPETELLSAYLSMLLLERLLDNGACKPCMSLEIEAMDRGFSLCWLGWPCSLKSQG
jgi:hypothetical protein